MNIIFRRLSTVALLTLSFTTLSGSYPGTAVAQPAQKILAQKTKSVSPDEIAIQQKIAALSKALANGEAKDLASLWTADATYINDDGVAFTGRDEIEKRFTAIIAATGKLLFNIVPKQIRLVSPTVAVSEGVVIPTDSASNGTPETRYTMVLVKQGGTWLISHAAEIPVATEDTARPLGCLDWMIGEWKSEKAGGSVTMKADWTNNNNFILCKYQIDKPGQPEQVEYQIVGWDPQNSEITSWHFDRNGGFGRGRWTRNGQQWSVESTGVQPDGKSTRAINVITMDGSGGFTWQSINRSIGGMELADTDPLKVERVTK